MTTFSTNHIAVATQLFSIVASLLNSTTLRLMADIQTWLDKYNPLNLKDGDLMPSLPLKSIQWASESEVSFELTITPGTHAKLLQIGDELGAALKGRFTNFEIIRITPTEGGNAVKYTARDTVTSRRLVFDSLDSMMPHATGQYQLMEGITWNLRTTPGAIIVGKRGSGKSYLTLSILSMSLLDDADVYAIDIKKSDLSKTKGSILPESHVADNVEDAVSIAEHVRDLMLKRQEEIRIRAPSSFSVDASELGYKPLTLFLEEVGAVTAQMNKDQLTRWKSAILSIILLGRESMTSVVVITQQANATNVPTEWRMNMGLKVHLGSAKKSDYAFTLDSKDMDDHDFAPRSGNGMYELDDGFHNWPDKFEAPTVNFPLFEQLKKFVDRKSL